MNIQTANVSLQFEIGKIMLGAVVLAAGVIAIGVSLFMPRKKDTLLLSWASFGLLWGASLLAGSAAIQSAFVLPSQAWRYIVAFLCYLLPVPFAGCLVGMFGKGPRNSYSWLLRAAILFAAVAVVYDLAEASPGSAVPFVRVTGILSGVAILGGIVWSGRKVTGEGRAPLAGFMLFAVCILGGLLAPGKFLLLEVSGAGVALLLLLTALGYSSVHRFVLSMRRQVETEQEMEAARLIQFSLLPQEFSLAQNLRIATRYVPADLVGGNFLDSVPVKEGGVCILLGDVAGRGIAAASLASILKTAFASHLATFADPAHLLGGMNRILEERTEHKSAAASCLLIDTERGAMLYANAGHPPLLIWRNSAQRLDEVGGSAIALGSVAEAKYANTHLPFDPGDKVIMYSKGITEALDPRGRIFGEKRFRFLVRSDVNLQAEECAEALTQHLITWTGLNSSTGVLKDDLTLVVIDILQRMSD